MLTSFGASGGTLVIQLADALAEVKRLGFDTAPIIYFVEAHPRYGPVMLEVIRRVDAGELTGVTSVVTLIEVLTQPMKLGAVELQVQYKDLLVNTAFFETVDIDPEIAVLAATLRARYNLRTPDALQVAASISAGCEAFLTNDVGLRRLKELRVIVLDDLVPAEGAAP